MYIDNILVIKIYRNAYRYSWFFFLHISNVLHAYVYNNLLNIDVIFHEPQVREGLGSFDLDGHCTIQGLETGLGPCN